MTLKAPSSFADFSRCSSQSFPHCSHSGLPSVPLTLQACAHLGFALAAVYPPPHRYPHGILLLPLQAFT